MLNAVSVPSGLLMPHKYHDDGESSLGPTIATLSLGARSVMSIRMKYKYYNGLSKTKTLLKDDPVLVGCRMEAERRSLKSQLAKGEIGQTTYDSLRRKVLQKGKCGEAPIEIKMELNHGDLVVMHGENLQKYYEVDGSQKPRTIKETILTLR
jgi:alkylated DNA repair dioxygenase AlkB